MLGFTEKSEENASHASGCALCQRDDIPSPFSNIRSHEALKSMNAKL